MMRMATSIAVMAAAILAASQAAADRDPHGGTGRLTLAQSGGQAPGTTAVPTSPMPPASGATPAELTDSAAPISAATFIERARAGNRFEVESSQLAEKKATQPALKAFAAMMIKDHTAADRRLVKLATASSQPTPDPARLEPRQQRLLGQLANADGPAFDQLYAKAQLEAHQAAVQLYQSYARSGTDARLRQFAQDTLPVLQGHLTQIESLVK